HRERVTQHVSTQGGTFMSKLTTPTTQPSQTGKPGTAIPHEQIAKRAYEKWCQRGCMDGMHQQDWLEAEAELRAETMGHTMSKPAQVPPPAQAPASRPQAAAPAMAQKAAPR